MADCERLELEAGAFDLIVSSNTLEHLTTPETFVRSAIYGLAHSGQMIIAVPPNDDPKLREDNRENLHHRSNLDVAGWLDIFAGEGLSARTYLHYHPSISELDFASHAASRFSAEEFEFIEVSPVELARGKTLTAVFELQRTSDA